MAERVVLESTDNFVTVVLPSGVELDIFGSGHVQAYLRDSKAYEVNINAVIAAYQGDESADQPVNRIG